MLVTTFLPITLYILTMHVFSIDILSLAVKYQAAMSYLGDLHERFLAQTVKCQTAVNFK